MAADGLVREMGPADEMRNQAPEVAVDKAGIRGAESPNDKIYGQADETAGTRATSQGHENRASNEGARSDQSLAAQRADAFDQLPQSEALSKHPELDGAYAQLREAKEEIGKNMTAPDERAAAYEGAKGEVSESIRRGEIPTGPVTREESEKVIDMAAAERGIKSVRDSDELQRDVKGEVVAVSSQHALVKLSDDVAVRFEKSSLDADVSGGDKVSIQYNQDKNIVHEQGKEPGADMAKEAARDMER